MKINIKYISLFNIILFIRSRFRKEWLKIGIHRTKGVLYTSNIEENLINRIDSDLERQKDPTHNGRKNHKNKNNTGSMNEHKKP